jgi:hypothetical protein
MRKGITTVLSGVQIHRYARPMASLILDNKAEMPAFGFGVFQTPPDETRAAVEATRAIVALPGEGTGFIAGEVIGVDGGEYVTGS